MFSDSDHDTDQRNLLDQEFDHAKNNEKERFQGQENDHPPIYMEENSDQE